MKPSTEWAATAQALMARGREPAAFRLVDVEIDDHLFGPKFATTT